MVYGYGSYGEGFGGGVARGLIVPAPAIAIDFLSSETPDPRLTISGGVNGWRVNNAGILVPQAAPRYDYDPVSHAARGLIDEFPATNLLKYSGFQNTGWAFPIRTDNATTSPDGTVNAVLVKSGVGAANPASQGAGTYAAAPETLSMFIKQSDAPSIAFGAYDGTASSFILLAFVAWTGGVPVLSVQAGAGTLNAPVNYGNGWWRVSITYTPAVAGNNRVIWVYPERSDSAATGKGNYIYGGQAEAGSFASSYIATTSATVTRTADAISLTGANFTSWYNPAQGTFFIEGDWQKPSPGQVYLVSNGSANRYIYDSNSAGPTNNAGSYDGVNVLSAGATVTGITKAISAYGPGATKVISSNGSTPVSGAYDSTSWAANTAVKLGESQFFGHLRRFRYWNIRLSDVLLKRQSA